ncbi:MAG: chemotaxis response regulator protein-glutamate methylesterase [Deltaproteobacteria bacterium]|nr:MAG: chemotaxis response regulator protein-glutamate methylesterase [Deltaproteobacteria bacterium]
MPKKISVMVVDDSAFMRKALKRMLSSDPMIRVVGEARDGLSAVEAVKRLKPDVVTLDVKMSGMNGLQALERIMKEHPTPVLMVSSLTSEGGGITLKALEAGAVDFIDKSTCHTTMDIIEIADSLVRKVKVIAGVDLKKVADAMPVPMPPQLQLPSQVPVTDDIPSHIVAIGASTGGPMSLEKVLTRLPGSYPGAILVIQHMPLGFTRSLAERLNHQCAMEVKEAQEDDPILPGRIYIGPSGYHLKLRRSMDKYWVVLSKSPRDTQHCPSVDVLIDSVARVWPGRMLGIILTGMGDDGAEGIRVMKQRGGMILAQNEETCVVYGMPKAAYRTGCVDRLVPLNCMAREICEFR